MTHLLNALKGVSGTYELNRLLGAFGVLVYIITVPAFVMWELHKSGRFDLVAYCTAYPAGLGAVMLAVSGSIALKDRTVAATVQKRDATETSQ